MRRQAGFSVFGWMVIVAAGACLGVMATRIFPVVYEYRVVRGQLVRLAESGELRKPTAAAVESLLRNRLAIDYVRPELVDDITLERVGDEYVASFKYERVVPIAGNVNLLFRFSGSSNPNR